MVFELAQCGDTCQPRESLEHFKIFLVVSCLPPTLVSGRNLREMVSCGLRREELFRGSDLETTSLI